MKVLYTAHAQSKAGRDGTVQKRRKSGASPRDSTDRSARVTGRVDNRSVAQTVAARRSTSTDEDLEREVGLLAKVGYCLGPSFSARDTAASKS